MELIPIKTRIMHPPKDDLYDLLDTYVKDLQEGDIVLITSKVLAIHQGRCVPSDDTSVQELLDQEVSSYHHNPHSPYQLTVMHHTFGVNAGIDESNGDGYFILSPESPFKAAKEIHSYLKEKHGTNDLGVIITDSHSLPFRYGAMSVSLGFYGFRPVYRYDGKKDLFGRELKVSRTNLPDAIAAGASVVSGEGDEAIPVVIARGMQTIEFTDHDTQEELLIPYEEDIFYPFLKKMLGEE